MESDFFVRFQLSRLLINLEVVKNVGTVMRDLLDGGVGLTLGCVVTE